MTRLKLSDNRVREIVAGADDVTDEERLALAQEVIDLRTANGILDAHVVDLEKRLDWNREAMR